MNRGLISGIKQLFIPPSLGGGDSANDGALLGFDSTQPGGVKPVPAGTYAPLTGPGKASLLTADDAVLRPWYAGLANRHLGTANLWAIGSSLTEGGGNTAAANRFVNRLQALLRARYPVTGVKGGVGYIPAYYTTTNFNATTSTSGAVTKDTNFGLGARDYNFTGAQSLTYTVVGTSVDVTYVIGGGGTLGYSIDSGAVVNIVQTGSLTDLQKTHVTLGAVDGSHTITFTAVSGGVYVDGLVVYNQDESNGVRFFEAGHSGWKASDFVTTSLTPGYFATQLGQYPPNLVLLEFGTNEYASGIASATFKTNMVSIINKINSTVSPNPSILLPWFPQRSDGTPIEPYANYRAVLDQLAATYANVGVADLALRMGATVAGDTLGLFADTVHPSDKGSALIADALGSIVAAY